MERFQCCDDYPPLPKSTGKKKKKGGKRDKNLNDSVKQIKLNDENNANSSLETKPDSNVAA